MSVADRIVSGGAKLAQKRAVYDAWLRRPAGRAKKSCAAEIAARFGLSVRTVERYVREIAVYGDGGAPRVSVQGRSIWAWDDEALAFLRSFFLAARRDAGGCTVRNAYRWTCREAAAKGWRVGSESSAYKYLANLSPVLTDYAAGGRRALDNRFWILRDLSLLRPFQIVVGDQHRFDFWCRDGAGKLFRPECYLWLDMRTRLVYGLAFDRHYSAGTVVRALRVGVEHFGKFECTYNDNGTAEKSAWADLVVSQLQSYGMRWGDDIANLYRDSESGLYLVRGDDGAVLSYAKDRDEWHARNRRIFAGVKNAKAKPVERFFSTLEQMLRDMVLPGYVRELSLSAPEEEEASRRLAWQEKHGYILSFEDFCACVARAVDAYNSRRHSSLGRSPLEELEAAKRAGWRQTFIHPDDVEYLFLDRAWAVVNGDRVRLRGRWYAGPPLTREMVEHNRGSLANLNRRRVEIRYNPDNPSRAWAVDPRRREAIPLHPVEAVGMLDADALHREISAKRGQIRAAAGAFAAMTEGARVLVEGARLRPLLDGPETLLPDYAMPQGMDGSGDGGGADLPGVTGRISTEAARSPGLQDVFATERERYCAILARQASGGEIPERDREFMVSYEEGMDDEDMAYISEFLRAGKMRAGDGNKEAER